MKILITPYGAYLSTSVSVAHLVTDFLETEPMAQKTGISAEDAQEAFPSLLKKLVKYLSNKDVDVAILECSGFKHAIRQPASKDVLTKDAPKLTHAVVKIGGMIVDPCRLRLGPTYNLPLSYPQSMLKQFWTFTTDVTHLVLMTPKHVQSLLKSPLYA